MVYKTLRVKGLSAVLTYRETGNGGLLTLVVDQTFECYKCAVWMVTAAEVEAS